jgi:hypothetical protein
MAYNQSRIKQFRRCQKQYSYRYDTAGQLGLAPELEMVRKVKSKGLEKGSWMHKLMEAHLREVAGAKTKGWKKVHKRLTKQFNALFEEEKEMLGDLPGECEHLFLGYLREEKKTEGRYTVATLDNGKPAIEFVVEVSLKEFGIQTPFKGQIDLLVEDHDWGGLWIRDHKNVKNIPSDDERMMSPQNCMYVWALRQKGYDIRGFVYNYLRTKPPTIPYVLKRSSAYGAAGTLTQRGSLDTDYYTYIQAIKDAHGSQWKEWAKRVYKGKLVQLRDRQWMWYRQVPIPVEDEKIEQALDEFLATVRDIERRDLDNPPRSYFYSCRWGCEYHELCTAEFAGLDIEDMIDHDFTFDDERYSGFQPDLLKE